MFQDQLLLKLPCIEIAHVCYVKEDGIHILAIKHGKRGGGMYLTSIENSMVLC